MPFSLYYLKDIYYQHGLPVVMPLVIRLLISFLHHRVTLLPSFSVLFSLEGSYYSQIYFSSGESCSTSLMVKHFQQLFGILLTKTFVFSSVVIHLSVSVRMHRYVFYTLHLYLNSLIFLLLKLFQLWPLNLSMDSCVPLILIHLIILYMCIYLFTYLYGSCWGGGWRSFMAQEVPGSACIFPAPALNFFVTSPRRPGFLYQRMLLETNI